MEHPLEQWARAFLHKVDTGPATALASDLSEDLRFTTANLPTTLGPQALIDAFAAAQQRFESIHHEIVGVTTGCWEEGDVVAIEARAHYFRNGREIVLPVTSTLRLRGDKVADYRIYIDPAPAFAD
ncbi:nuclear transport factor 2 family protein [Rhodobacteraceae bacterium CH30]|nr:nuclear transport factor 2 family protein [Rhodobacteraceae bacterium CH30]